MFRVILRENIYLALLEEHHAATVFALVDQERDYLRRWLPWVDATETVDDSLSFIRASLEQFSQGKGFAAGIWMEKRLCGVIGTHKLDLLNRSGEIGYWLARPFQGQGIATAACGAVVRHLFEDRGLHRITIHCARRNERSCAVARRLGFAEEGLAREAHLLQGEFQDIRVFSLLERDWKPQRSGL